MVEFNDQSMTLRIAYLYRCFWLHDGVGGAHRNSELGVGGYPLLPTVTSTPCSSQLAGLRYAVKASPVPKEM